MYDNGSKAVQRRCVINKLFWKNWISQTQKNEAWEMVHMLNSSCACIRPRFDSWHYMVSQTKSWKYSPSSQWIWPKYTYSLLQEKKWSWTTIDKNKFKNYKKKTFDVKLETIMCFEDNIMKCSMTLTLEMLLETWPQPKANESKDKQLELH